jgi:hypothetical protein
LPEKHNGERPKPLPAGREPCQVGNDAPGFPCRRRNPFRPHGPRSTSHIVPARKRRVKNRGLIGCAVLTQASFVVQRGADSRRSGRRPPGGYDLIVLANLGPPAAMSIARLVRGWLGARE